MNRTYLLAALCGLLMVAANVVGGPVGFLLAVASTVAGLTVLRRTWRSAIRRRGTR